MAFPVETEVAVRRRMLDICQDHVRGIVEITRNLSLMLDSMAENKTKAAKDHYENMRKTLAEADKLKTALLEEVASVGSLLISREDFLKLVFTVEAIADYAEGVAFRLAELVQRNWKLDKKYLTKISELASLVLQEIILMRDTMMALNFNPTRAIELSRSVESLERKIDSNYRMLGMEVLNGKLTFQTVLLLRDIIDQIEHIADTGADAVDIIRILALTS